MSSAAKSLSDICVDCGSCCDGTLFPYATLDLQEDKNMIQLLNIEPKVDPEGRPVFDLPCQHYDSKCTVFEKGRLKICGDFYCRPIRGYQKGELSFSELDKKIQNMLRLKRQFLDEASKFDEVHSKPVHHIRQFLLTISENPEKKDMMRKYSTLFMIGFKFFPVLDELMPRGREKLSK